MMTRSVLLPLDPGAAFTLGVERAPKYERSWEVVLAALARADG
jgi:hypothetical protein